MIIEMINVAVRDGASEKSACELLGLAASTVFRWRKRVTGDDLRAGPTTAPSNKLTDAERHTVIETACSEEFRDLSPNQIVPKLADRGEYIASESTFYRVLREERLAKPRGKARPPRKCRRPALKVATKPRQIWSWDITYLRTSVRGMFFYAYMTVDIWSRKIVAAQVHAEESSEQAAELMTLACSREGVTPRSLTLHADNGSSMKGATMLATLQGLGVHASFSRPRVSDDNPFSESLFRTLKYRPDYPSKPFDSLEDARAWIQSFVRWYNDEHMHSAIGFVTPSSRHRGEDAEILNRRTAVYERARTKTPKRWSRKIRRFSHVTSVTLHGGKPDARIAKAE